MALFSLGYVAVTCGERIVRIIPSLIIMSKQILFQISWHRWNEDADRQIWICFAIHYIELNTCLLPIFIHIE